MPQHTFSLFAIIALKLKVELNNLQNSKKVMLQTRLSKNSISAPFIDNPPPSLRN
jgi:hypothetical protein